MGEDEKSEVNWHNRTQDRNFQSESCTKVNTVSLLSSITATQQQSCKSSLSHRVSHLQIWVYYSTFINKLIFALDLNEISEEKKKGK